MKRIVISVTNDLVTDQRVAKVCDSLQEFGFDILLIGRKLSNSFPVNKSYKIHRIKLLFNKGFLFYAEYNLRLFFKLLFTKKDLLLSNDLDTLLPNYLISKLQHKYLVYDSHELFTEVPELINRPRIQKVWLKIEKTILPKLKTSYTVCQSIADYYNSKYQTNFKVIKNLPIESVNLKKKNSNSKEKIIIYQGALNLGRGVELMIKTMQYLENYKFIIAGEGDISSELKLLVKNLDLYDKVVFLGRKKPTELKEITLNTDLGISFEEDLGLNYRFALPNKIFDYINAQIPILVSNLPEMKRIVEDYNVGEILLEREPTIVAKQIQKMLNSNFNESLNLAKKELNWQSEKDKLFKIFQPFI